MTPFLEIRYVLTVHLKASIFLLATLLGMESSCSSNAGANSQNGTSARFTWPRGRPVHPFPQGSIVFCHFCWAAQGGFTIQPRYFLAIQAISRSALWPAAQPCCKATRHQRFLLPSQGPAACTLSTWCVDVCFCESPTQPLLRYVWCTYHVKYEV